MCIVIAYSMQVRVFIAINIAHSFSFYIMFPFCLCFRSPISFHSIPSLTIPTYFYNIMVSCYALCFSHSEPPITSKQFPYKNILNNSFIKLFLISSYDMIWMGVSGPLKIMIMGTFKVKLYLMD